MLGNVKAVKEISIVFYFKTTEECELHSELPVMFYERTARVEVEKDVEEAYNEEKARLLAELKDEMDLEEKDLVEISEEEYDKLNVM